MSGTTSAFAAAAPAGPPAFYGAGVAGAQVVGAADRLHIRRHGCLRLTVADVSAKGDSSSSRTGHSRERR